MHSTLVLLAFLRWANAAPAAVEQRATNPDASALASLQAAKTTTTPANIAQASAALAGIFQASPSPATVYAADGQLISQGLTSGNFNDALAYIGAPTGPGSSNNVNPRNPVPPVYPSAGPTDAPYDISEAKLRAAIYIPPGYRYGASGAPQPCILIPGTGNNAFTTFDGNIYPLIQRDNICDPVLLNVPGFLLDDAQNNAEYVAYAIGYIYGISPNRKVALIGWSQGNIDAQWAFKYWPSTRGKVTDQVAFSPDYHGTINANFLAAPGEPLPPSLLQQEYNANFITTLRRNGGDSAYVPTTTIYSGVYDEIVEPQQGILASAYLNDARGAGVTNNEVQLECPLQPAGSFYSHEGTLYNPLGYALLKDALANPGPGRAARLNLPQVCSTYLTPGLTLADFALTENTLLIAGATVLTYPDKRTAEPAIKPYATY